MTGTGPLLDLAIRGGRVVTGSGDGPANVGVRNGRVVALGSAVGPAEREIDARGKLVVPGAFDAHVHLTPVHTATRRLAWADDYSSGTRAAAAGGVTTIGDVAFAGPDDPLPAAMQKVAAAAEQLSLVDFVLHPVVLDPSAERLAELDQLAAAGFTSIKVFMHLFGFDANTAEFMDVLHRAGELGLQTLVHAEDAGIISHLTRKLTAEGRTDLSHFPDCRPVPAEAVAVQRAVAMAEVTGAPIYLVHVSSGAALQVAAQARAAGAKVSVETRPIYLLFDRSRFDGPDPGLYVGNPPLRETADIDALWTGLQTGTISTCCTDHAPWRREEKLDPSLDIGHTRPGMADLETLLSSLFSHGVRTGRLSLQRFVEVTSTNAARLFGIFPRKGTIAIGSDADLVVFDPEHRWTVRGSELQTAAKMNLLEGQELTGRPEMTISRGEIIMADGRITAPGGRGRLITRHRR